MCETAVQQQFPGDTTKSLYIDDKPLVIKSIGALLDYLKRTQRNGMERMNRIMLYTNAQYMHLDINARRNLELTETMRNKEKRGSLLSCWKTKTPMQFICMVNKCLVNWVQISKTNFLEQMKLLIYSFKRRW